MQQKLSESPIRSTMYHGAIRSPLIICVGEAVPCCR
jgi:hypothetical protein